MLTRRFFLGGLASAFALGPRRIFSAPPGAFTGGKPIMISSKLISRHPETKDKAYQAWKDETNRLLNMGFGNSMLPEKGFYDD